MPANPAFVVVPYYRPAVVFAAPAPGFFVGGAIRFGFGVSVGAAFRPWGWGVVGYNRFDWGAHRVFINASPWGRTWVNRGVYVHSYPAVHRFTPAQRVRDEPRYTQRPNTSVRQRAKDDLGPRNTATTIPITRTIVPITRITIPITKQSDA